MKNCIPEGKEILVFVISLVIFAVAVYLFADSMHQAPVVAKAQSLADSMRGKMAEMGVEMRSVREMTGENIAYLVLMIVSGIPMLWSLALILKKQLGKA